MNVKVEATWYAILQNLWRKACAVEGIDPAAKFVVFSSNNNYANFYNAMLAMLFSLARHESVN